MEGWFNYDVLTQTPQQWTAAYQYQKQWNEGTIHPLWVVSPFFHIYMLQSLPLAMGIPLTITGFGCRTR